MIFKKIMKWLLIVILGFVFFILFFLLFSKKVWAQVLINEFSSNSNPEWVEIYNNTPAVVDLTNWKMVDLAGNQVQLSGCLAGSGFRKFNPSGYWLNNDGDSIFLKDSIDTPIDQVVYGPDGDVGIPSSSQSAGRQPDGGSSWVIFDSPTPTDNSCQISLTPTPSLTQTQTPTSSPSCQFYSSILITEYLPNPESGSEWVELYNGNNFEVNLNGWYIDDEEDGGENPISISGSISSYSYKRFYLNDESYLNNDGDDVRLLDCTFDEEYSISFDSSTKGKSWSRDSDGEWCEKDPTPNSANPDCPTGSSSSPTSTPIPTKTPTPTPKLTPTKTPTPTPTGQILGQEASSSSESSPNFFPLESSESSKSDSQTEGSNKNKVLPLVLLFVGMLLLGTAVFFVWYTWGRTGGRENQSEPKNEIEA